MIKKHISRQIIQRIPKPNILPQRTNDQEQLFQMASFHRTPKIIQVRPIDKNCAGDLFLLRPQNSLPLCPDFLLMEICACEAKLDMYVM